MHARIRRSTEAKLKGRKATEQKEGSSRKSCSHFILRLLCSARRHKVQIKAGTGDYPGCGGGGGGASDGPAASLQATARLPPHLLLPPPQSSSNFHRLSFDGKRFWKFNHKFSFAAEKWKNLELRQDSKQETGRQQQQQGQTGALIKAPQIKTK